MAVMYNSVHVDEKYAQILEPNLFYDQVFQPGQTFTDKYQVGPAGGLFVYKPGIAAVEPGAPGRDFTDANVADDLIGMVLNNNFQRSRKIYGVQAQNVGFAKAETELSLAIAECRQGYTLAAAACLVKEGTEVATGAALTVLNIKQDVLLNRKTLVDAGASANVLLCNTKTYALILEFAGTEFTPIVNESVANSGRIGRWLGFLVIECNALSATSAKYIDYAGVTQTVVFNTAVPGQKALDYVMYDFETFSVLTNFETTRVVDSERFVGSLAQVEMNVGYRVTTAARAIVRKTTVV